MLLFVSCFFVHRFFSENVAQILFFLFCALNPFDHATVFLAVSAYSVLGLLPTYPLPTTRYSPSSQKETKQNESAKTCLLSSKKSHGLGAAHHRPQPELARMVPNVNDLKDDGRRTLCLPA